LHEAAGAKIELDCEQAVGHSDIESLHRRALLCSSADRHRIKQFELEIVASVRKAAAVGEVPLIAEDGVCAVTMPLATTMTTARRTALIAWAKVDLKSMA
jgi:hypothetical protein